MSSTEPEYTRRLQRLSGRTWKRLVPNPYRWNVRRLATGRVLDVGCGIGRCLDFVQPRGVGVDPNDTAIAVCRANGHEAYNPADFAAAYATHDPARQFNTMLCSHVLEHLDEPTGVELIRGYLPHLVDGARVLVITPQEHGQRSDSTHVRFMDAVALNRLLGECGLDVERVASFPFPRIFGRWFVYNETVTTARMPAR